MSDPWKSARDEFMNETIPWLKEHGMAIGEMAKAGDGNCKQLIGAYAMLHRSFDPVTFDRMKRHIEAWKDERRAKIPACTPTTPNDASASPR